MAYLDWRRFGVLPHSNLFDYSYDFLAELRYIADEVASWENKQSQRTKK